MKPDKKSLLEIAHEWRTGFNRIGTGGVVLIYQGTAYGWKNEVRNPEHECPGAIAVDESGNAWIATGGNDYDGAKKWEAVL